MALQTFGVTAETVRRNHFPTISAFSANTKPTDTAVTDAISDVAAEVSATLLQKSIDPALLSSGGPSSPTYPIGYQRCARFIRIGAAVQAMDGMTQKDGELQKRLLAQFNGFMKDLKTNGWMALGDAPEPQESAVGPRTHIDNLQLDTGDSSLASDAIPPFRKSDDV